MKIYQNIEDLVGKTPLVELSRFGAAQNLRGRVVAKLECKNPAGSIKDRIGLRLILDAEKAGALKPGGVIVEPTSGNTGIGIAAIARARGYRVVLTMPDSMSIERRNLLKAYGAELILTEGKLGMAGAVKRAEELAKELGGWIPGQFYNPSNPRAHYETTGPEIWADTDGGVAIFVAGVGTGGTLSGTAKFLKEKNPDVKIYAVEPAKSPLLNGGAASGHGIQGIGANFIPDNLDRTCYQGVIDVEDASAIATAREIARTEGLLLGISSGAAVWAAAELAKREENADKLIVVVCPDSGERYLSAGLFD